MFEHMGAAELFQGPVVLTFSIARDGFDLEFETSGCAAGRARAFSVCVSDYLNLCFVKHHCIIKLPNYGFRLNSHGNC